MVISMRLSSFEAIIGALHGAEVRYLIAGGLAAVGAHGYLPRKGLAHASSRRISP